MDNAEKRKRLAEMEKAVLVISQVLFNTLSSGYCSRDQIDLAKKAMMECAANSDELYDGIYEEEMRNEQTSSA